VWLSAKELASAARGWGIYSGKLSRGCFAACPSGGIVGKKKSGETAVGGGKRVLNTRLQMTGGCPNKIHDDAESSPGLGKQKTCLEF